MRTFKVYKPNSNFPEKKGAAFQFAPGRNRKEIPCIYVTAAQQSSPKPQAGSSESPFTWSIDNTIRFKLEAKDVSMILSVLRCKKDDIDIVHKFNKDGTETTTSLKMKQGQGNTFALALKQNINPGWRQIFAYLDAAESILFEEFLTTFLREYFYGDPYTPEGKKIGTAREITGAGT